MTTSIKITATPGTPSGCCDTAGALDYHVTIERTGETGYPDPFPLECEVTLVPSEYDGTLCTWGQLDHWLSGSGVALASALSPEGCTDLCRAIEAACRDQAAQEIDLDVSTIEAKGAAAGAEAVDVVAEEQAQDRSPAEIRQALLGTIAPGVLEWDESAINGGVARLVDIPPVLEDVYYAAYAAGARARVVELTVVGDVGGVTDDIDECADCGGSTAPGTPCPHVCAVRS
jgi:hypothetical protein